MVTINYSDSTQDVNFSCALKYNAYIMHYNIMHMSNSRLGYCHYY